MFQQLGSIFRCEGFGAGPERLHGRCVGLRRRRGARCNRNADFKEKFFQTRRRTIAKKSRWLSRFVFEVGRGVRWNVDALSGPESLLQAKECVLNFAFQNYERLLKIVAMRRRTAG